MSETKSPAAEADDLKAKLAAMRDAKLKACEAELNEVLARHNCKIVAVPGIAPDGRIVAQTVLDLG